MRAIAPISMDHQGYEARRPQDAVTTDTFGICLSDDEGLDFENVLEQVDHCNPNIHFRDIRTFVTISRLKVKYKAKGSGEILLVLAVPRTFAIFTRGTGLGTIRRL